MNQEHRRKPHNEIQNENGIEMKWKKKKTENTPKLEWNGMRRRRTEEKNDNKTKYKMKLSNYNFLLLIGICHNRESRINDWQLTSSDVVKECDVTLN